MTFGDGRMVAGNIQAIADEVSREYAQLVPDWTAACASRGRSVASIDTNDPGGLVVVCVTTGARVPFARDEPPAEIARRLWAAGRRR